MEPSSLHLPGGRSSDLVSLYWNLVSGAEFLRMRRVASTRRLRLRHVQAGALQNLHRRDDRDHVPSSLLRLPLVVLQHRVYRLEAPQTYIVDLQQEDPPRTIVIRQQIFSSYEEPQQTENPRRHQSGAENSHF